MADWSARWFDPYRGLLEQVGADAVAGRWDDAVARLNRLAGRAGLRNENGCPVRFVDPSAAGESAYEAHIWATGGVPTRTGEPGGWHDLFNALAWLTFPRTKARLNRLQARSIDALGVGDRRGTLRDAATLFDENAALLVTDDPDIVRALRGFDWPALLVRGRARFEANARVLVFGHALLDKLRAPYKAVCAHAWVVAAPPRCAEDPDALDAMLAASLDAPSLRSAAFSPLPVLGIPGWWAANEAPSFYEDPAVFRAGRRASAGVRAAGDA